MPYKYKHDWGAHPQYGVDWRRCKDCGISRVYDSMPGWPGWYEYFSPEGASIKTKIYEEPECVGPPLLRGL